MRGRHGVAYLPAKHPIHDFKNAVRAAGVLNFERPLDGPVKVVLQFVFQRPRSHWNKKGLKPNAPAIPPKNDFDNLAKAATDPLNGIAWHDDDQITSALIVRRYAGLRDEPGRTVITVSTDEDHRAAD